jgi:hypothetical protein
MTADAYAHAVEAAVERRSLGLPLTDDEVRMLTGRGVGSGIRVGSVVRHRSTWAGLLAPDGSESAYPVDDAHLDVALRVWGRDKDGNYLVAPASQDGDSYRDIRLVAPGHLISREVTS